MQALNAAAMHALSLLFQGVFVSPYGLLTPSRLGRATHGEKRSEKRVSLRRLSREFIHQ